ncbi:MAG: Gx transporter family protein [Clostridia bacterium]|nr:Gx transporter family protein [Clostridia bacterium]
MKDFKVKNKYFSAKRVATLAVLTAMGLIMFMVESLFPPLFLPGAKMGLSNIFSMLTLFLLGPTEAFVLVVVRTVLGSMFTGNMSTLMYSLTAGIVSVAVSSVLVQFVYPKISIVAISVVSAIMHNVTQNVVFCLVSNTPEMFSYMPWLALLGILAGVIVGFAVWFILRMVPTRTFVTLLDLDASSYAESSVKDKFVEKTETKAEETALPVNEEYSVEEKNEEKPESKD